jgi:hypothetical protein
VTTCCSCKSRRFGEKCRLHHQGDKNRRAMNVSRNYQPKHADSCNRSTPIHVALVMEEIVSSETSVLIEATRSLIPEDVMLLREFHGVNLRRADTGSALANAFTEIHGSSLVTFVICPTASGSEIRRCLKLVSTSEVRFPCPILHYLLRSSSLLDMWNRLSVDLNSFYIG